MQTVGSRPRLKDYHEKYGAGQEARDRYLHDLAKWADRKDAEEQMAAFGTIRFPAPSKRNE